jgi:hypothetical protein
MISTTDLDDKIRDLLVQLDQATPAPPSFDDLGRPAPADRWRAGPMVAAAAIVVLGVGGIVAVGGGDRGPATQQASSSAGTQDVSEFHWATPTVTLDAASVEVITSDRTWVPTDDLVVVGDPGRPNESTTLELTWHDDGIEQRVFLYFASDGVDWWVREIRTYDGQVDGEWVEPSAQGEYFRSPLGSAFVGDLDLPNLQIKGMTLEAFLPPVVCDNPITPIALVADYPTINSGIGGAVATFQMIDTTTCTPVPVADFQFEYVSDDPAIVKVDPPEVVDGYPEIKSRVELNLLAPGSTTVRATARNNAGEIVSTSSMNVAVSDAPLLDEIADTVTPPPTVPATSTTATESNDYAGHDSQAELDDDIGRRVDSLTEHLVGLGYSIVETQTTASGPTTIAIQSNVDGRTIQIKMGAGTPLQPEDHNRVPITIVEQTELQIRGYLNSNSGWTFEFTADRSASDDAIPTVEQLQEMLYSLDP